MSRPLVLTPSLWSDLRSALLELGRALRTPSAPQPVPIPLRPPTPRRLPGRNLSSR